MENQIKEFNHSFTLLERKNISISGIKKIESFDNEEFLIDSVMGIMIIKGNDLELLKLDTREGIINIKGNFTSLNYIDSDINKKNKESSVISRLFK